MEGVPLPVTSKSLPCPVCCKGVVNGIYVFPLSLAFLDQSVELRKQIARKAAIATKNSNGKRGRDVDIEYHEIQAETPYLLLAQRSSVTGSMSINNDLHRTGRWTPAEIAFVDLLLSSFDQGSLPLPHGIKLNEFLGDILLCKSSRLTKKMKNAKLSTRSYELMTSALHAPEPSDYVLLSNLQEQFLQSVPSEPTQLELMFNITKLWRTQLSNLCVQVGYSMLHAGDWLQSLDDMEHRASQAEASIRKARRRRMGLAFKADASYATPGVFFAGQPVNPRDGNHTKSTNFTKPATNKGKTISPNPVDIAPTRFPPSRGRACSDTDFLQNLLAADAGSATNSAPSSSSRHQRIFSEDFSINLDELFDPATNIQDDVLGRREASTFLDCLADFIESKNLPFEYVDIWVPSYRNEISMDPEGTNNTNLRLFFGGHAIRKDLDGSNAMQLHEWGLYSKNFSFAPSVGLPGRVFISGKSVWEGNIDQADPKFFERVGGARVYGIKTVLGIPLPTSFGKVVVAFYSLLDIPKDPTLMERCVSGIACFAPEARWRLVVDVGSSNSNHPTNSEDGRAAAPKAVSQDFPIHHEKQAFDRVNSDLLFLDHSRQKGQPTTTTITKPAAPSAEESESSSEQKRSTEEQSIASLLGQFMPISDSSTTGQQTSSNVSPGELLRDFMQLRLLLLRARDRRTSDENEMLDILRSSFRGYSVNNRRSGSELANLLIKDWQFLRSNMEAPQPRTQPQQQLLRPQQLQRQQQHQQPLDNSLSSLRSSFADTKVSATLSSTQYQSHVMDLPPMAATSSSQIAPVRPPSLFPDGASIMRRSNSASLKEPSEFELTNFVPPLQRKITMTEVPESPQSSKQLRVNVVDEH